MAFNALKSTICNAGKLLTKGTKINTRINNVQSVLSSSTGISSNASNRCFTRSLWYMCSHKNELNLTTGATKVNGFPKMCGCCGLHTEGDKEIAEFLKDEIKMEKENNNSLPKIGDFEVHKLDGADVVLKKTISNETITIRFNINHSVDDSPVDYNEENEEQDLDMTSRPAFTVEMNKGSERTLAVQCQFPQAEELLPGQPEEEVDTIEISEVAVLDNNDGNWDEKYYCVSGAMMDGNLYDKLLNMLAERGINEELMKNFLNFTTNYDHQNYVKFLEELQDFVMEK